MSLGQAFANKTLIAMSVLVQGDDAQNQCFASGHILGPTGQMITPVQGGDYAGVGLPKLKRPVRCVPGVKLFVTTDEGADAVSLASMAVYCASGKSAIFSVKAVDATKTELVDVLTGGSVGQSLAGERIICSYQTYPATKGLNDNQAGNSGFYIESSDGQLKLMVPPVAGHSSGSSGNYLQGSSPYVEYSVGIPIDQNDTLSVMAGL